ncbi:MAG: hypothetical protein VSS75_016485 [Candidatus Parabeggiatoa sp.]|nr:hypothetical protein [Candidatus Parabeggiatoa sp.]
MRDCLHLSTVGIPNRGDVLAKYVVRECNLVVHVYPSKFDE